MIYFDSAASYPVLDEVQRTLSDSFKVLYGNSTASHMLGLKALDEIEIARESIADKIGAMPSEIVFTSGATESNNLALKSVLLHNPTFKNKKHIVTSTSEHKCVLSICNFLHQHHGFRITYVKPNALGIVTREGVSDALDVDTCLVSIMHVNNELGTINEIEAIGALCFEKGVLFHSDAAQSFCKESIDVDHLNVDLISLSAHKIGGPKGIGAAYIRELRNKQLMPILHGAGQEEGLRGGTVAAPLIKAFSKAIEVFPSCYKEIKDSNMKQILLKLMGNAGIKYNLNGTSENTVANIVSISLRNVDVASLIRQTEEEIALAQGSACSSKQIEPSHVLVALGLQKDDLDNTLRLSFTHTTTELELDRLVQYMCQAKYKSN